MVKTTPETILLIGEPNRREYDAAGTITPGDLLELNSSGDVIRHNSAAARIGPRYVAVENDIAGDDITHDYASGEVVQVHSARPGEVLLMRLSNGESVVIGDFLASDGAGRLDRVTSNSSALDAEVTSIFAVALEAKDMSDSSGADPTPLFRVEVI